MSAHGVEPESTCVGSVEKKVRLGVRSHGGARIVEIGERLLENGKKEPLLGRSGPPVSEHSHQRFALSFHVLFFSPA